MDATPNRVDVAIVGGGLAGGLTALALRARRPELSLALIDAGERFGGNHIWSFFASDVAPEDRWLVEPLIAHRWPAYDVRFPAFRRTLDEAYHSIESERLDAALRAQLPARSLLSAQAVADVAADRVTLADGRQIGADAVIDARGAGPLDRLDLGWQKFVGQELRLATPHGLDRPVVMDATVDQAEGYRFVYLLPFAADRVFVEDTYYAADAALDVPALRERIADYAATQGWTIAEVLREETGVLPVAMGGDLDAYLQGGGPTPKIGVRAGLFQPTTGYSLPDAIRAALLVAENADLSAPALARSLDMHAHAHWRRGGFCRLLDRMLFRAAEPAERYRVLQRFYTLDAALIGRFYAGRSTLLDKARILMGKPPVPIGRAIGQLAERRGRVGRA